MDDILNAIMQGAVQAQRQQGGRSQAQADPMADLISGILGGGQQKQRRQQPQQADMMDIIGSIMGGAQQQQRRQQQPQQAGIEDIIGAIMGGSQRQGSSQAGGMSDLIGAIMGGGRQQAANPIAQIVAQKFGIPPAIAQAAVSYFMAKMMGNMMQKRRAPQQQVVPDEYGIGRAKPDPTSMDLDDLLESMDDDDEDAFDSQFEQTGMAEEFAEKAGIDRSTAGGIFKEILKAVGQKRQTPEPVPARPDSLEDLLDNW